MEEFGKKILIQNKTEDPKPLGEITGSESVFIGRVVCDSVTGEGQLNKNSVLLEGIADEYETRSRVVKLDLDAAPYYSLFPDQVRYYFQI